MDAALAKQLGTSTRSALDLYQQVKQLSDGFNTELVLPEIVVIGKQSAGKSSVLTKLLSGAVSFPASQGTCTRCPIVVYSRFGECQQRCTFSLRYRYDDRGKPLREIETSREETVIDAENWRLIPEEIKKLQTKILKKADFTLNEVIVHVEGTEFPDLDIKDLPGLISNGKSKDIQTVKQAVKQSISTPSSTILVCVPCTDDIDNQEALQIAAEVDPGRTRTIGVLTKPDRLEKGAEEAALEILRNDHPKAKLQHGWFVVRAQSPDENNSREFDNSLANEAEVNFFDHNSIGQKMKRDARNGCGTQALLGWISNAISQEMHQRVPVLFPAVNSMCEKTEKELERTSAGVTEANVESFISNTISKLQLQASRQIRCEGNSSGSREYFKALKRDYDSLPQSLEDTQPIGSEEGKWNIAKVEAELRTAHGRELFAGTNCDSTVKKLIHSSLILWPPKVDSIVRNVHDKQIGFFTKLVDSMQTTPSFADHLRKHLEQIADDKMSTTNKKAEDLLREHGCTEDGDMRYLTTNQKELQRLRCKHMFSLKLVGQVWRAWLRYAWGQFCVFVLAFLLGKKLATLPAFPEVLAQFDIPCMIGTYIIWCGFKVVLERFGVLASTVSPAWDIMAQAMAYWELCVYSFADALCRSLDDARGHSIADGLAALLKEKMQIGKRSPEALMQMMFTEEDMLTRANLQKRLAQEKETRVAIETYMNENCNSLHDANIKDAAGSSNSK